MGKKLIQQRRGKISTKFNSPSHRFKGEIKYDYKNILTEGTIVDILHDPGRTAPIASVKLSNDKIINIIAPEGIKTGDKIKLNKDNNDIAIGNILSVGKIPEGAPIYNIELLPGDGGKLVRAGGSTATVVSHDKDITVIRLPSGSYKRINSNCKATVGVVAGGGRHDKPFLKAGKKHYAFRTRGKQYPIVRGVAMCSVSHPHGGGRHQHVGGTSSVKRGSSPGTKVGNIAPKRSGRK
jgi:large subunit ribosomal protein L2